MKRTTLLSTATMGLLLSFTVAAASPAGLLKAPDSAVLAALESNAEKIGLKKAPLKAAQNRNLFLFEDFESYDPYEKQLLPEGWTTIATPGNEEDVWQAGTLYLSSGRVAAPSGERYAYIITSTDNHDAWAISPGFEVTEGKEYYLSFYTFMLGDGEGNVLEELYVKGGYSDTPAGMTIDMVHLNDDTNGWKYCSATFTAPATGTFHIGLHATSPGYGSGILIDNLTVCPPETPIFAGPTNIELDDAYDLTPPVQTTCRIANYGSAPLTVQLKESSPEIKVSNLPVTLPAGQVYDIALSVDVQTAGLYEGSFTLATDDDDASEITISVKQQIEEASRSGYWFETFDAGIPATWSTDYMVSAPGMGIDGTNCAALTTQVPTYCTTPFTEMGDNPELRFNYLYLYNDFFSGSTMPVPAANAYLKVSISDDGGQTFDTVWEIDPQSNPHTPTTEFLEVSVPLSDYAGKTCLLRFETQGSYVGGFNYCTCYLDNVELGTCADHDLQAVSLRPERIMREGVETSADFRVYNNGRNDESGFTLTLSDAHSGKVLAMLDNCSIDRGTDKTFTFTWMPTEPFAGAMVATIALEGDTETQNDSSVEVPFIVTPTAVRDVTLGNDAKLDTEVPWDMNNNGSVAQMIYTANEIGVNKATISGVAFRANSDIDFDSEIVELYIGETSRTDFADQQWIDPSSLTKVYSASIFIEKGNNEVVIPFSSPYQYNGGNIVIYAAKNSKYFVPDKRFAAFATELPRTIYNSTLRKDIDLTDPASVDNPTTYNLVPAIRFVFSDDEAGSLTGIVTSSADGTPIADATVTLHGTSLTSTTDARGAYSFGRITPGSYQLDAVATGYVGTSVHTAPLADRAEVVTAITMVSRPVISVKGRILDADSKTPVAGAGILLSGYNDYHAITGEDGSYTLTNIYGGADLQYTLTVLTSNYRTLVTDFIPGAEDMEAIDFEIKPRLFAAHCPKATTTDDNAATITWEEPIDEFRQDGGEMVDCAGFDYNNISDLYYAIMGNAFTSSADIKEISWYTCSDGYAYPAHEEVNLFIFPLDKTGFPIHKPLYSVTVPNVDNQWNTFQLPSQVKAEDGFLVAISYSYGSVCLGLAKPTAEYPLEESTGWYHSEFSESVAGPEYGVTFFRSKFNNVFMIRAAGENNGAITYSVPDMRFKSAATRPTGYNIYRIVDGERTLLARGTTETTYVDNKYGEVSDATTVVYGVEAQYAGGVSDMALTGKVQHDAGISGVITDSETGSEAEYFNLQGIRITNPLPGEIYIERRGNKVRKVQK
ncbi:MAG TPA: carboxypeptidase regulatory-like domain-containing protein [Candidatus Amulumruptor caecigallinarius]|uniref:Carboxypeptidase regulatory-like domain-containing protein n=1 Tax=Candidatus Amulumruptor caecigallinarius TaxID=2109911 RepID=A0A921JIP9_9BACT|nr:carboxypeptidase regulatory-like domain-containing protein [Candidatus Amulumruptor caecigallinarius]